MIHSVWDSLSETHSVCDTLSETHSICDSLWDSLCLWLTLSVTHFVCDLLWTTSNTWDLITPVGLVTVHRYVPASSDLTSGMMRMPDPMMADWGRGPSNLVQVTTGDAVPATKQCWMCVTTSNQTMFNVCYLLRSENTQIVANIESLNLIISFIQNV